MTNSTHLSKTPTHLRKDKLISVANCKCLSNDKLNTFEQGQMYKCLSKDKVLSIKQGQTLTDLSKDKLKLKLIWARTNLKRCCLQSKDMPSKQWQVFEQGHAFKTMASVWARTKCCQLQVFEQGQTLTSTHLSKDKLKCCQLQVFKQGQTQHIWARTNL